jgi:hypothetical protein
MNPIPPAHAPDLNPTGEIRSRIMIKSRRKTEDSLTKPKP